MASAFAAQLTERAPHGDGHRVDVVHRERVAHGEIEVAGGEGVAVRTAARGRLDAGEAVARDEVALLRRHLRHAFDENGTTLFGLLKSDDLDFEEIEKHLLALAKLPASHKLPSIKELAAEHGLSTEAHPDAELIRDIESGRRLTHD